MVRYRGYQNAELRHRLTQRQKRRQRLEIWELGQLEQLLQLDGKLRPVAVNDQR